MWFEMQNKEGFPVWIDLRTVDAILTHGDNLKSIGVGIKGRLMSEVVPIIEFFIDGNPVTVEFKTQATFNNAIERLKAALLPTSMIDYVEDNND